MRGAGPIVQLSGASGLSNGSDQPYIFTSQQPAGERTPDGRTQSVSLENRKVVSLDLLTVEKAVFRLLDTGCYESVLGSRVVSFFQFDR